MRALLLVATLCSIHFRSGHTQVALTPVGKVGVCVGQGPSYAQTHMLRLTCRADGVLWSTSGFGEGLDDQMRIPALSLAHSSLRVTTTDTSILTNTSSIILTNFTYGDHGAMVTCEDHLQTDRQSVTLSVVGPLNCTVSLTASRVTADSAVVRWAIKNCIGSSPTRQSLSWYPVGKLLLTQSTTYVSLNFSSTSQYRITGLSPSTKYFIIFSSYTEGYWCGYAPSYSAIVETLMSVPVNATTFGLVAVIVVLFPLLLLLTTILVVVCIKSKLNAAATRKKSVGSGEGGGGLKLSKKDESPYKEMNPTHDDINVDLNPAYQSMESAMYA